MSKDQPFTFKFGDSEELSDRLIALVREGKKTATCGALREYGPGKFERTGGFDPEMVLVCERFRLVRDLEADPD